MDELILAQRIIGNSASNIDGVNVFHNYSPIYKKSNERTDLYLKYFENRNKLLSVIASGDQILNGVLAGIKNVDAFDISVYPRYYLYLKMAGVQALTKDEYLKFFYGDVNTDEIYDDIYDKISPYLDGKVKVFWDSLMSTYDWYDIYYSTLFSSEPFYMSSVISENKYLQDDNFDKLKKVIRSINLNLYTMDLFDTKDLKGNYDIVYFSNIIYYVDPHKYKDLLSQINLVNGGVALTYFYHFGEHLENHFIGNEYKFDKFEDNGSGVMFYKRSI